MGQYLVRRTHHPTLVILGPKCLEFFALGSPMGRREFVVVVATAMAAFAVAPLVAAPIEVVALAAPFAVLVPTFPMSSLLLY